MPSNNEVLNKLELIVRIIFMIGVFFYIVFVMFEY